jgi:purine-binding chemotaxis protein CheW
VSNVHVYVRVGAEGYALPVDHVLEVLGPGRLSPLPGAAAYVLGLRNVRGQVVPVFDLAALVGAGSPESRQRVCVASHRAGLAGLAVDEVTDVAELPSGGEADVGPLLARSTLVDGRLVGVVDAERLFTELERRGGG